MSVCSPFVADNIGRITVASSSTRPTGADRYEGKIIWESDTNKLMVCYDGTNWREVFDVDGWTTYTPTIGGFAIGNGSTSGLYRAHPNNTYEWWAVFTAGSTSTYGAQLTISYPATLSATNTTIAMNAAGHAVIYDTSAGTYYAAQYMYSSTTTGSVWAMSYDPTLGAVNYVKLAALTSAIPMAWATGDQVWVYGTGTA